ncbi:MAG TPA: hypothetical protein VGP08_10780 [Pyrinomonadaceae bacterium]|jgi:hypothetical protein|nr:hypothetical protein [Pyrinomonadaceae bacterium]
MPEIYDMRMHDGSRHFASLPESESWESLHEHVRRLEGVSDTSIITDEVTEAWIDFSFRGREFSINNQSGEFWFFVEDPACPEEVLEAVLTHCKLLLERD